MKWEGRRQSGNVEDRRGTKVAGFLGGGSILIALIYFAISGDPSMLINSASQSLTSSQNRAPTAEENQLAEYAKVVLADTEDTWHKIFSAQGLSYEEPKLVLFTDRVDSACGQASAAVGPFYCPRDKQVYLDLSFAQELTQRLGANGDFAFAYVIAHEVGHHVQNLLGGLQNGGGNAGSVRTELQADCYAGLWAADTEHSKNVLDAGDIQEALSAAEAVGDDKLQKQAQGYVVPDSFTHGSSAQRMAAFQKGYSGNGLDACKSEGIESVSGR